MLGKLSFMKRATLSTAALVFTSTSIALSCPILAAQTSPQLTAPSSRTIDALPTHSFDVATIKPNPSAEPKSWMGIRNSPDGMEAAFVTIPILMQRAYGLRSTDQVSGGPEWTTNERFDIEAKMSEVEMAEMQKLSPSETKALRAVMLQALLVERFKLKVHSETRQAPVFELVVAKGGPKLQNVFTDPNPPFGKGDDGKPLVGFNQATKDTMVAQGESTKALADLLSQPTSDLGRPVVDKTGLNGAYDFTLNWVPHWDRVLPASGSGLASPEEADSLFEALQQIGLKLQSATGLVNTIVIDNVARPSEN